MRLSIYHNRHLIPSHVAFRGSLHSIMLYHPIPSHPISSTPPNFLPLIQEPFRGRPLPLPLPGVTLPTTPVLDCVPTPLMSPNRPSKSIPRIIRRRGVPAARRSGLRVVGAARSATLLEARVSGVFAETLLFGFGVVVAFFLLAAVVMGAEVEVEVEVEAEVEGVVLLGVVVVVRRRFRSGDVEILVRMRGREWPVVERVEAMFFVLLFLLLPFPRVPYSCPQSCFASSSFYSSGR